MKTTEERDNWASALLACRQRGEAHALATVIATSGSTPRDSGSKMLVTTDTVVASIGGGGLEQLVVNRARELLATSQDCQELRQFALGAEAQQCCGGSMTVLLECFAAAEPQLVIFGAGHVCHALVSITGRLSLRTLVVDSRPELLAALPHSDRVRTLCTDDPVEVCSSLNDNSLLLVMTHDHRLDYSLVRTLLEPWRWSLLGMIGSATKAHRFRMRLRNDGIRESDFQNLQSPIGITGLKGKLPMEVAVSVSAGLMQHLQGMAQPRAVPDWRATKALLKQAREA